MSTSNLDQQSNIRRFITPKLWIGCFACLTACASLSVNGGWQEGVAHPAAAFTRILVVGVTPNYNQRCNFEYTFASRIRSASTQALSSCDSMKADDRLTPENIKRVVTSTHVDAVFATTLVASHYGVNQNGTYESRDTGLYKPTGSDWGIYGMPVTYVQFEVAPSVTTFKNSVHILTKVFETQNATLVYTVDTETKGQEFESTNVTIVNIAGPSAERLRKDGLIR